MAPRINAIVAVCENMGIGVNGTLPWKLKSELATFKRLTLETRAEDMKNMVIMGRRTWESIPAKFRPLPGRINVILSSTMKRSDVPEDVLVYSSIEAIVQELNQQPLTQQIETAWVIGGSSVYRSILNSEYCHRVYLTKIQKEFDCDTYLDPIDEKRFRKVEDSSVPKDLQEENGTVYSYHVFERIRH